MRLGTKSLLFGVHQFIWHPITVYLAWVCLYGKLPNIKETVCIIIHDWGYWGCPNMDGKEGERHPEFAAGLAHAMFGERYFQLCLLHSRHYARGINKEPSMLCWADKFSICYDPWWLYLPRAWLSGELYEYRRTADRCGAIPESVSHIKWFEWIKGRLTLLGQEKRADIIGYANKQRNH